MQAIIEAIRAGRLGLEPTLVLSDRPDAPGLEWARSQGLATAAVDYRGLGRQRGEAMIEGLLHEAAPDWIALAGFMRILGPRIVHSHLGRIVNIHPSLLPRHPGLDTYRRALAEGDSEHGSTVHFVDDTLDGGPRIARVRVPILPGDDPERLTARTKIAERRLYPWVLKQLASGILRWEDGRVLYHDQILGEPIDATAWLDL